MNIAVLLPTIYRPEGLRRVLDSLAPAFVDVIVIREIDDIVAYETCIEYMVKSVICEKPLQGPAYAWNTGLKHAQFYDAYFLASDDTEFIPGWYGEVTKVLKEKLNYSGIVGVNDGTGKYERAGFATQFLITRDFIVEHNGGVVACPHYYCDFVDVELTERAKAVNKFAYADKSMVIHHWREHDDMGYRKADDKRSEMRGVYLRRKANNFPDDYERIIK